MIMSLTLAFLLGYSWIFTAEMEAFFSIVLISMKLFISYDGRDIVTFGRCTLKEVLVQERYKIICCDKFYCYCFPIFIEPVDWHVLQGIWKLSRIFWVVCYFVPGH